MIVSIPFSAHRNNTIVSVPFKTHRIKRKLIMLPASHTQPKYKPDQVLVAALAKAWYWQKMIDHGKFASAASLAKKYRICTSDVARILKLNLLAPNIRKAILDGTQPRTMNMQLLKKPWPMVWEEQRRHFSFE